MNVTNVSKASVKSSDNLVTREELFVRLAGATPPMLLEALDEQYYESGHLPGAIALPLSRVTEIARARLRDKSASLVVYCASSTCQNSRIAAAKLQSLGYEDVRVYAGGKADWKEAGLPLEVGVEKLVTGVL